MDYQFRHQLEFLLPSHIIRVSILVLMDYQFRPPLFYPPLFHRKLFIVSILVLMDYQFRLSYLNFYNNFIMVSILVLMDYQFRQKDTEDEIDNYFEFPSLF